MQQKTRARDATGKTRLLNQPITDFHLDEFDDWVAELACGHNQHVRHNPPWTNRPWVTTVEGRQSMIGHELACKKCDTGVPPDRE